MDGDGHLQDQLDVGKGMAEQRQARQQFEGEGGDLPGQLLFRFQTSVEDREEE